MSILSTTCPHCLKENVAFQSVGEYGFYKTETLFTVFFKCGNCEKGLITTIETTFPEQTSPHYYETGIDSNGDYKILETYPKSKAIDVPKYLPDNIHSFYLQAAKSLRIEAWDASAAMSGKAIEITCKHLDTEFRGTLYQRIESLAAKHIITESMKEWAHETRLGRNTAAHEEEPYSPDEAKELLYFAEVFLMYAFTLPGMLKERRAKK